MLSKKWSILVAVLVIVSTLLAACGPAEPEVVTVEVTKIVEKEGETVVEQVVVTATPEPEAAPQRPNILHINLHEGDVPTLDPSLSTDTSSVQVVDELTIGLTKLNEVTLELEPGMAESWDVSDDGMTYVFHLREGIPWVRWNGEEVEEVLDCEGNVRYVTAHDFEYAAKRTCNPDTASDYAYVLGFALRGCNELLEAEGW